MARVNLKITKGTAYLLGGTNVLAGPPSFDGTPGAGGAPAPSTVAVAADVATLVADGATPTQAHVTTLNTDWGTLLTAIGAAVPSGDVSISVDNATVTTMTQLRAAFAAALQAAAGSGSFTA